VTGQQTVVAARWCKERLANLVTTETVMSNSAWHARVRHVIGMCDRIETELLPHNEHEKAQSWLGFVQGWLWANGFATLDELKEISRI
jgi:hypothetical protein